MIIMPQIKELQLGNLPDVHGTGGVLLAGSYRRITGIFSSVNFDHTEIFCIDFDAIITDTGLSLLDSYNSFSISDTFTKTFLSTYIPPVTLLKAEDGTNGEYGGGGGGAAGGGVTEAQESGKGGTGGNGGWGYNEQTAAVILGGIGKQGGRGGISPPPILGINGSTGINGSLGGVGGIGGSTSTPTIISPPGGQGGGGGAGAHYRYTIPGPYVSYANSSGYNGGDGGNGYVFPTDPGNNGGSDPGFALGGIAGGSPTANGTQGLGGGGIGGLAGVFPGVNGGNGAAGSYFYNGSAGGGGGGRGAQGAIGVVQNVGLNGGQGGEGGLGGRGSRPGKSLIILIYNNISNSSMIISYGKSGDVGLLGNPGTNNGSNTVLSRPSWLGGGGGGSYVSSFGGQGGQGGQGGGGCAGRLVAIARNTPESVLFPLEATSALPGSDGIGGTGVGGSGGIWSGFGNLSNIVGQNGDIGIKGLGVINRDSLPTIKVII